MDVREPSAPEPPWGRVATSTPAVAAVAATGSAQRQVNIRGDRRSCGASAR